MDAGMRCSLLNPPGRGVRVYVIRLLLSWECGVQIEVQFEYVNSRLSEQT
jgi:hypothetical protein